MPTAIAANAICAYAGVVAELFRDMVALQPRRSCAMLHSMQAVGILATLAVAKMLTAIAVVAT